jgi:hypothetical protein
VPYAVVDLPDLQVRGQRSGHQHRGHHDRGPAQDLAAPAVPEARAGGLGAAVT